MNRSALKAPLVSLDDFEELLADAPDDERWELIGGRVVRMMVGARWEHNQIITNLNVALVNRFRADRRPCPDARGDVPPAQGGGALLSSPPISSCTAARSQEA